MMKLDYAAMGRRVRECRNALKLTQEMLAERADVSPSFVGHIERGEKKASAGTIVALAAALDVDTDYLLLGRENRCDRQRAASTKRCGMRWPASRPALDSRRGVWYSRGGGR